MKTLTMIATASILALMSVQLGGCAVATAGVKKGDERNFARSLNDINAARAIKARMTRVEGFSLKGVDVEVAEGIALLSGNAPTAEDRIEAERIAWSAPQVQQVGNEIFLNGKQGFVRNTKDGVLNKSIRTRLTANKNIKARNYNIEVHDGIVYLLGVARTPEELAHAAHIASTTKGAREVVSYVTIAGNSANAYASVPAHPQINTAAPQSYIPQPAIPQSGASSGNSIPYEPGILSAPQTERPAIPQAGEILDGDAIESGEPYYLDPQTGERVEIPEGVTPIPYIPDSGPGSLGAGGQPLPPGAQPSQILGVVYKTAE